MYRFVRNVGVVWMATLMCAALIGLGAGCAVGPNTDTQPDTPSESVWGLSPFDVFEFGGPENPQPEDPVEPSEPLWCADVLYPPANEPDGCYRRMLTMDNTGAPFNASSTEPTISRGGELVAFTVLPTEEFGVNGLTADTNLARDVYAVDLRLYDNPLMLVSVNDDGKVGDGDSFEPSVSSSGRFVAFTSYAENLTANERGGYSAIFVRDLQERTTELVSRASHDSLLPDADAHSPLISANGRFVAFLSKASNLVDGDSNEAEDLFLRDRLLGTTERLSLDSQGEQVSLDALPAAGISDSGRYVLFSHPSALTPDAVSPGSLNVQENIEAYRLDRHTGKLILVSRAANGDPVYGARAAALSADGAKALLRVGRVEVLFGVNEPGNKVGTVIAHMSEILLGFELVYIGSGFPHGMSDEAKKVVFASTKADHGLNVQLLGNSRATANAYAYTREASATQLLTASNEGVPGVIHDYDEAGVREKDWVSVSVSGAGDRFVISSIQYGLIEHPALHCKRFRPRLIYLVTCNRNDY